MMRLARHACLVVTFLVPVAALPAQRATPIRELAPVEVASSEPFRSILNIRQLRDGSVLVNDGVRRQLVLLDPNLALKRIVIDSISAIGQSYGPVAAPIIPFLGDSTLFVDGRALSLVVIDPNGNPSRVMSAPNGRDLRMLAYTASFSDNKGNLIYPSDNSTTSYAPIVPGRAVIPVRPDSNAIVRANFDTRRVDTIGRIRVLSSAFTDAVQLGSGQMQVTKTINPVITPDEWAVLSDGSIAFIRGHDYHIDWLLPNGERRSSEKLPFDWKPLTNEAKLSLIDSARKAEENAVAAARLARKGAMAELPPGAVPMPDPILRFVPLKDMGDYYPAIRYGAAKPDMDGALWILPTTSAQSRAGELVYDVVNNRGVLTERVRIPRGRSIAGFGPNGVVYLMFRDDARVWHLERTRVMRQ